MEWKLRARGIVKNGIIYNNLLLCESIARSFSFPPFARFSPLLISRFLFLGATGSFAR